MSLGGLVSYGSSDEDDISEPEEQPKKTSTVAAPDTISDEEDFATHNSILDESVDDDIPGLTSSKSFFSSLPSSSASNPISKNDYVDENEDLSTIPSAKQYEDVIKVPAVKSNKKRTGPVKIMAPSLIMQIEDDEEEKRPIVVKSGAIRKSGLISLLPAPKSGPSSSSSESKGKSLLVPRSVARKPPQPSTSKPVQKPRSKEVDLDSSDDDDDETPFFTMNSSEPVSAPDKFNKAVVASSVKANPEALGPEDRPLAFGSKESSSSQKRSHLSAHPSNQYRYSETDLGPATAPYPPPPPTRSEEVQEDLLANEEALERLAGRINKRRRGEQCDNVIDVNYEDIKPDEREWLTKALTEDDADKPGPKNTIGGNMKRKHQITYLAAMAKEREQDLKKQWAANAQTRKTASSKYGF